MFCIFREFVDFFGLRAFEFCFYPFLLLWQFWLSQPWLFATCFSQSSCCFVIVACFKVAVPSFLDHFWHQDQFLYYDWFCGLNNLCYCEEFCACNQFCSQLILGLQWVLSPRQILWSRQVYFLTQFCGSNDFVLRPVLQLWAFCSMTRFLVVIGFTSLFSFILNLWPVLRLQMAPVHKRSSPWRSIPQSVLYDLRATPCSSGQLKRLWGGLFWVLAYLRDPKVK